MLERVKWYMTVRELSHVQNQQNNSCKFLKWNEFIFGRRNLAGRVTFLDHFIFTGLTPFMPLGIYSLLGMTIPFDNF